jgi:prolyl-tRNA synthetase
MRYAEIPIQTHRENPASARSQGAALLVRAGYISHSGELLPLGQLALQRLRNLSAGPALIFNLGLFLVGENEIFYPVEIGDTEILHCPSCGFAARLELASVKKTVFSTEPSATLENVLTPDCPTIESLAAFLGIPQQKTAKALMFVRVMDSNVSRRWLQNREILDSAPGFVFVVVRGDMTLSEAKLTALVGEVRLATEDEIRAVGAVPGYASPLGVKNALIVVDDLIPGSPNLVAGANQAGYHVKNVNYGRDYSADLVADLTLAAPGDPCAACGGLLEAHKAWVLASHGVFDYENILSALAETHHDDKGLTLPASAAPFDVYLMHVPGKTLDTLPAAEELYRTLAESGLSVLFDDRNERAGVKFNDADLVGCPVRITVGERGLQNGVVELKKRTAGEVQQVALRDVIKNIRAD